MAKMRIKAQHFYNADGQYIKSLKYYSNGVCPDCGRDILTVRGFSRRYVLDAEKLKLLVPGGGVDSIYDKNGIRHMGRLAKDIEKGQAYIAGYSLHKCGVK